MNLHAIVSGAVGTVNPPVSCTVARSTGYSIGADGTQSPTYQQYPGVVCQIQPMSNRDLQRVAGLNIQGIQKAIYLNGQLSGLVRVAMKGGDLITEPNGNVWLTTAVLEHWDQSGWCKVAATLQDGN